VQEERSVSAVPTPASPLRELINTEGGLLLPGIANALTARIAEDLGFSVVCVTGASVSNTFLDVPDIALLSPTEMAAHVRAISDAVDIPVIVDADTGFGNAASVGHMARILERAGASATQLEDQVSPKRCDHFEGQEGIPGNEMRQKIYAAVDARRGDDTLVVARTDARAGHGLQEALDRVAAYAEAGADVLFIEGLHSRDELRAAGKAVPGVPKPANMVEGGKAPLLPRDELLDVGFSVVLYANAAMQGAIRGTQTVLKKLRDAGSLDPVLGELTPWDERQRLVRRDYDDQLESRYSADHFETMVSERALLADWLDRLADAIRAVRNAPGRRDGRGGRL
jgi:2-methylisocitrate lyase-like PEP mutase family enzyme